jgi:hypothetical protein
VIPECFAGLVVIAGSATARPLPCSQPHAWETFAVAILPAEVQTFDQPMVAADPAVRQVCSERPAAVGGRVRQRLTRLPLHRRPDRP